uniref:RanBP2-type domain-containing protein n=1 Tax=Globodera pallida TaxID=36090 RepID=A0A183C5G9_GLOPA
MSAANVDDASKTENNSQHSDQAESTASSHIPPEIASLSQLSISEPKTKPSSPTAPNKWTLWRYDCRDMPGHKCFTKPCAFCDQVDKLKGVSKGKATESTDRWESYLKKGKSFDDEQMLTKTSYPLVVPWQSQKDSYNFV